MKVYAAVDTTVSDFRPGTVLPPSPADASAGITAVFANYHSQTPRDSITRPNNCGWLSRLLPNSTTQRGSDESVNLKTTQATLPDRTAIDGVSEYLKVLAQWLKDGSYTCDQIHAFGNERADGNLRVSMMDHMVAAWRQSGVFESLMDRVIARHERDGTLDAKVNQLMAHDPFKGKKQAEQEARAHLARWDGDRSEKTAKFDLLLYADSDTDAADDSAMIPAASALRA